MSTLRELHSDEDLQTAVRLMLPVRVFQKDHLIERRTVIIRFTQHQVVTQEGPHDIAYHDRDNCQFFELKR